LALGAASMAGIHALRAQLTCPACEDVLREPHMLPCQHALCEDCVSGVLQSACPCVECQQPFSPLDVLPSPLLLGVVQAYRAIVGGERP
jgi:hypothetical protein